jgi:hypothetical protein
MFLFAGTPAPGSGRSATRRSFREVNIHIADLEERVRATDDCCRMRENPLRFLVTAGHERLELESDSNPATAT